MIPKVPEKIHLSTRERQHISWANKPGRRHDNIPKFSTLPRVDRRLYRCQSCDKTFANAEMLKRHAQITHTGTKPVTCEICNRRFSTERHMLSHYNIHNEPRLEEFNVLLKRSKKVRSLPTSFTTVGSFAGVPKGLKSYKSEPTFKSFGTRQTFNVSEQNNRDDDTEFNTFEFDNNNNEGAKQFMTKGKNQNVVGTFNEKYKKKSARRVEFSATTRKYSDISDSSDIIRTVHEAQYWNRPTSHASSYRLSPIKGHYEYPTNVSTKETRHSRQHLDSAIPTKSFGRTTKSTVAADDSRTPSPKTFHTGTSYSEAHRQLFSASTAHFWDAPGYSKTSPVRRMSGVTSISGYDPFVNREQSPRKPTLKSVKSASYSDYI